MVNYSDRVKSESRGQTGLQDFLLVKRVYQKKNH